MGDYAYPDDFVKLRTTKHFIDRLEQRGIGVDVIPTMVRVTKDNIYCADAEGKEFRNVVVRLEYNWRTYIFLCFNPVDGYLKTLWFRDKNGGYASSKRTTKDSRQTVPDAGTKNEVL